MNWLSTASALAGALGLFLLGMAMMTEGLKLAAGRALERILAGATRTRWHALGSGMLITALVQSSSAVTVAAIGFVNAGLLGLGGALWVLFGANVGTTMTGWIVALLGLKIQVEALALPLIGLGVLLRLSGAGQRRGALGTALAGFGLLFLGIAMLQQAFVGLADQVELPRGEHATAVLAQLAIGVVLTVLMQSSSASMTVALTAAQGGLLDAQGAAAVVIGANIGTTVTAVLAALGATANARRAAAAHVIFNVLTALVALALLPWLVTGIASARQALDLPGEPAAELALFHTLFNLMGVLLIWPVAPALTRWLNARFRAREDDEAVPRHLDDNVLAVPALAVDALQREVARQGLLSRRMLRQALEGDAQRLGRQQAVADRLGAAVDRFVERMNRSAMSAPTSLALAQALRIRRHHESAGALALQALEPTPPAAAGERPGAAAALQQLRDAARRLLDELDADIVQADSLRALLDAYEEAKAALLQAGAAGTLTMGEMDQSLAAASALRRALQQAFDAQRLARGTARPG